MEIERDIFPGKQATTAARPQNALPTIEQKAAKLTTTTFTAGTDFTVGAGAAGTAITIYLPFAPILGAYGRTGAKGNSSITLGGALATTLATEVAFVGNDSGTAGVTTNLANGEYMIDYEAGIIYGKKADAGTTGTAAYSYWLASSVAGTGTSSTQVQGTAAADAAAVGNPVQVGGVYVSSDPTLTTGDVYPLKHDSKGNLSVTSATLLAGENLTRNVLVNSPSNASSRITTNTTTVCKSGAGSLVGIWVEVATTGIITVYDNTAASGTVLLTIPAALPVGEHVFPMACSLGVTVVTAAADRVAVSVQ